MTPSTLQDYARLVARRLRDAGHQAFFVGGCVRDLLLGRMAKDFDIATDAEPDSVVRLFPSAGLVGAQFGVALVREGRWQVEVATFRSDGDYSDGRRPRAVRFVSDPRLDAARRDFTINAMFLDPETNHVLDFAGGRQDLAAGLVRAIGAPEERFQEDHLRLLRAVRFAARLGFAIESATFEAMTRLAPLISLVAPERVRLELNQILTEGAGGLDLLESTGLLRQLLPEIELSQAARQRFARARPGELAPSLAWAALLLDAEDPAAAMAVAKRLRFSQAETDAVRDLLDNRGRLRGAASMKAADLKRFLREPAFAAHLALHRLCGDPAPDLPSFTDAELHPRALLTGLDLIDLGYPQGPLFSHMLSALEDAQLEGALATRDEAVRWLRKHF